MLVKVDVDIDTKAMTDEELKDCIDEWNARRDRQGKPALIISGYATILEYLEYYNCPENILIALAEWAREPVNPAWALRAKGLGMKVL